MAGEVLYVSLLYWAGVLILFVWLNRRLATVTARLAALERDAERGKEP